MWLWANERTFKGDLAEEIFNDLSFPKHEKDFNQLSDYIEMQSDISVPMSEFDDLYEEYIEWLKFWLTQ